MIKILKKLIPLWPYLLLFILFLPAIWDFISSGYFPMHDDLQIFRLQQLDKCIKDLQIPCRWIPDGGFGYGYPMFAFYPPLPYYPAEVLYLLGFGLFWPIKIMFALSLVLSGFFMFKFARVFFGFWGGLIAGVFYVYAPYHSVDVYVRGALNEAWGMVWFPLLLLYSYQILKVDKVKRSLIIKFALSFSALMLSHNVMTLIFTPLLAFWVALWFLITRRFARIKDFLISSLFALGLAAFFFFPVVLESKYVHVDSMTIGYFNYLAHFADFKQMFLSRFWGYGGSTWGPTDDMAFPIGQVHWLIAGLVLLFSFWRLRHQPKLILIFLLFTFSGLFYAFLAHSKSIWFWQHIPLLYYAQFPWRLITIPAFSFSLVAGGAVLFFKSSKLKIFISLFLIISVIVWNIPFFKVEKHIDITREEKLAGSLWELQVTGGIFDYLPSTASRPPGDASFQIPKFILGQGAILDYQKGSDWMKFNTQVSQSPAQIMLPLFEYPGMEVKINSQKVKFSHDEDLGRIIIDLPDKYSSVSVRLQSTPVRTISTIVTILTLLITFIYTFYSKKKI